MITSTKQQSFEFQGAELPEAPTAPDTLQETGLTLSFLNDLILRTLYARGGMLGLAILSARYLSQVRMTRWTMVRL